MEAIHAGTSSVYCFERQDEYEVQTFAAAFYFVPVCVYAISYCKVYAVVLGRSNDVSADEIHAREKAAQSRVSSSRTWKVGRMVLALVGTYVICWSPYYWLMTAQVSLARFIDRATVAVLVAGDFS